MSARIRPGGRHGCGARPGTATRGPTLGGAHYRPRWGPTSPRLLQHRYGHRQAPLPDAFPVCLAIGSGDTVHVERARVGESSDQLGGNPQSVRSLTTVIPVHAREHDGRGLWVHRLAQIGEFGVVAAAVTAHEQVTLESQRLGTSGDL